MWCGHRHAVEAKVKRRAGVMQHRSRVTHVDRGAHDCVNTHMAHCTNNHNLFDAFRIELLLEIGFAKRIDVRSEEHTSELQSLMRISSAVFCLQTKKTLITYTQ